MEIITEFFKQDLSSLIIGLFVILYSIIVIYEIVGKFSKMVGKPVGWIRNKENDHILLLQTVERVETLQKEQNESVKQSIRHDETIRNDLKKLTDIFVDKQINDYRWEIINFSNKVANNENCNKDSYKHCLSTYEKYERLLEENDMENGEVEISIEIVNESYKNKLKNGFSERNGNL